MDNLHYADFLPHLNSSFHMESRDGAVHALELMKVTENSPSPRQEQFVLLFRAPLTALPEQSLYQLSHAELGEGALFLVPVSRDDAGLYFEAVFNRPLEEA